MYTAIARFDWLRRKGEASHTFTRSGGDRKYQGFTIKYVFHRYVVAPYCVHELIDTQLSCHLGAIVSIKGRSRPIGLDYVA